jgi:hypothetical protein
MQETEPNPNPFVIDAGEVAGQLSKDLWAALNPVTVPTVAERNQRRNAIATRRKANKAAKQARKRSK